MSRGHVVWQAQTLNIMGNSTKFYLRLSQAMSPAVRILAFATVGQSEGSEVISDSVSMEVRGQCEEEVSADMSRASLDVHITWGHFLT